MRPLLLSLICFGVLGLLACNVTPDATSVVDHVGTADDYAALPLEILEAEAPLCVRESARCELPPQGYGAVGPDGDAVVGVAGGRRVAVARVRPGVDTAMMLGRDGSGPGEYQLPALLGLAPNGDALVMDLMSRRVLRFGPDGESIATSLVMLPPAPTGGFGFVQGEVRILSADRLDAAGDTLPLFAYAMDSGATAARQLYELEIALEAHGLQQFRAMPGLFVPAVQYALFNDGRVAIARGSAIEVEIFDATGRLERRVGYALAPRAVTSAELAAERESRLRGLPSGRMREAVEQRLSVVSEHHPAVTRLVAMSDGELWVRESPTVDGDSVPWVVVSADGVGSFRVTTAIDEAPIGKAGARYLVARPGTEDGLDTYWWMRRR